MARNSCMRRSAPSSGQSTGVVILSTRSQKRKFLKALNALRKKVQRRNPDLTAEEAYRLAGFSEEVIQETLRADAELAASDK